MTKQQENSTNYSLVEKLGILFIVCVLALFGNYKAIAGTTATEIADTKKNEETLRKEKCTQVKIDKAGACCKANEIAYCYSRYNVDGTCTGAGCCDESTYTLTKFDKVGVCCKSNKTAYCREYNEDGTCDYAACGDSNCTQVKIDNVSVCCETDKAYCRRYNEDGTCAVAKCCDESTHTFTKIDNAGACCYANETAYCEKYNTDGTCIRTSCTGWNVEGDIF